MAIKRNRFSRIDQPFKCISCGKSTAHTESAVLCDACYYIAGLECEHQDGSHEPGSDKDCPLCNPQPVS